MALGVATVFDVDDLVFDTDYVHLLVDTLALPITPETWDGWFAIVGRTGATLRLCDRVVTTNRFLADKIAEFTPGKPVAVIPNFLNAEQLAICERMLAQKQRYGYAVDPPIYLGYFSGTPTHAHDFAILIDALARLLDADKRLVLRLVGHVAPPPKLARFAERIDRYPLQDFLNLQRLIGQTELNLVPRSITSSPTASRNSNISRRRRSAPRRLRRRPLRSATLSRMGSTAGWRPRPIGRNGSGPPWRIGGGTARLPRRRCVTPGRPIRPRQCPADQVRAARERDRRTSGGGAALSLSSLMRLR